MHCIEAKNTLDAINGLVQADAGSALERHLEGCGDCREYARDRQLRALLSSMPVRDPMPGFEDRVLMNALAGRRVLSERYAHLKREQPGRHVHFRWALASAAGILLAVILTLQLRPDDRLPGASGNVQASTVEVMPGQLRMVNVMLASPRRMEGAVITVQWDDNLEIDGYEGLTQLQWRTNLKDGHNQLSLPVQLLQGHSGNLNVTVEHEGASKHFSVRVNAAGDAGRGRDQAII